MHGVDWRWKGQAWVPDLNSGCVSSNKVYMWPGEQRRHTKKTARSLVAPGTKATQIQISIWFTTWFLCHPFQVLWSQGCVIYHTEFSPLGAQAAQEASVGTGTSSSRETLNQQKPYACANQSTSVRWKKNLRAHTVPPWIVSETQDNVQLSIRKMTNKNGL